MENNLLILPPNQLGKLKSSNKDEAGSIDIKKLTSNLESVLTEEEIAKLDVVNKSTSAKLTSLILLFLSNKVSTGKKIDSVLNKAVDKISKRISKLNNDELMKLIHVLSNVSSVVSEDVSTLVTGKSEKNSLDSPSQTVLNMVISNSNQQSSPSNQMEIRDDKTSIPYDRLERIRLLIEKIKNQKHNEE